MSQSKVVSVPGIGIDSSLSEVSDKLANSSPSFCDRAKAATSTMGVESTALIGRRERVSAAVLSLSLI